MSDAEHPGILARIGLASARRPWVAIAAWTLVLVASIATAVVGITGENIFQRFSGDAPSVDGESSRAEELLSADDPGDDVERLTLLIHGVDPSDPALAGLVADAVSAVDEAGVTSVDPLAIPRQPNGDPVPEVASLFAEDGDGVLVPVTIDGDRELFDRVVAELDDAAADIRDRYPEATVEVGGSRLLVDSILETSESDLRQGEIVALPIALVVMLVVFGGFIAAGLPLLGAGVAIVTSLGALFGLSVFMEFDTTVVNVVTAVGLGLSIDYGLLMVSRFREEYRAAGPPPTDPLARRELRLAAIGRTAATAGRTVLFSGTIFAIASAGLLVFEVRMVRGVGIGALAVTVVAMVSALTLIPALLRLTGSRLVRPGALTRLPLVGRALTRFGDVAPADGFFSKLTRKVQRHPAIVTLACVIALVALGSPLLTLRLANTSVDVVPKSSTQYVFTKTVNAEFPDAAAPRVSLVTTDEASLVAWSEQVADLEHVVSVGDPVERGDGWTASVRVDTGEGVTVVQNIRETRPSPDDLVSGIDARTVDLADSLVRGAPWAILIIALGTFVFLFLATGSFIVPIKALLASALSLSAAIGVLVWGFEQGNLAGLMNFDASQIHGVDVLVLVLALVFGFGLAMDYELFILSRITDQLHKGVPTREAIALGLQRSGRIISSAALIIIVVFAGFATGQLMVIKALGVALAAAVFLDATIVRCLLVPALMSWQERIMWWAPRWAKRLHARLGLRED
jgi:RND superfamily putative drug exporter